MLEPQVSKSPTARTEDRDREHRGSWRGTAIGLAKRWLWRSMRAPFGYKLARLVAEEWAQAAHFAAVEKAGPKLDSLLELEVRRGPFAGMRYPSRAAVGSTLYPKLLGSYERELYDVLEDAIHRGYSTVVDIGAAEGYYAVGLAMRMPKAAVIAYETQAAGQAAIRSMAEANQVATRVRILGTASTRDLAALEVRDPVLVVCDCEGGEYSLLDPERVSWLQKADILIEVHQMHGLDGHAELQRRFAATHTIESVDVRRRDSSLFPELDGFDAATRESLLFERTDFNGWMWCVSKVRPDGRSFPRRS